MSHWDVSFDENLDTIKSQTFPSIGVCLMTIMVNVNEN